MSTQVKKLRVYTKNHTARIRSEQVADYRVTSTSRREDDNFRVLLQQDSRGTALVISNVLPGSSESVVLNGRQIRTLRRVLDKHFYNL